MTSDKTQILNTYRAALVSIASNGCCDRCQEAALVAQKALRDPYGQEPVPSTLARCDGCDGYECDAGCQYPGVVVSRPHQGGDA